MGDLPGLISDVEATGIEGEQVEGPDSFPLLCSDWVRTGLKDCDLHKVLGVLSLVTGDEVVCHLALLLVFLVVGLVVCPPQGHWPGIFGGACHSCVVGSGALWSA